MGRWRLSCLVSNLPSQHLREGGLPQGPASHVDDSVFTFTLVRLRRWARSGFFELLPVPPTYFPRRLHISLEEIEFGTRHIHFQRAPQRDALTRNAAPRPTTFRSAPTKAISLLLNIVDQCRLVQLFSRTLIHVFIFETPYTSNDQVGSRSNGLLPHSSARNLHWSNPRQISKRDI